MKLLSRVLDAAINVFESVSRSPRSGDLVGVRCVELSTIIVRRNTWVQLWFEPSGLRRADGPFVALGYRDDILGKKCMLALLFKGRVHHVRECDIAHVDVIQRCE